ncbi:hypothetical protein G3I01_05840 [Gramella sp. MT6]|uniref:PLDc N-terminal domain-containing protein n=1 Tax=Gramella sp. MT6 TaxID=2705471 RepID=UPI001C5FBE3D|nr:PLDc N-terminal domain-containing protein [Gramella sp. MT6]QYA25049.1 hypothetical protein G3I01_05840 [Gramella sp. MT6]
MAPEITIFLWQTHLIIASILGIYILLMVRSGIWLKIAWILAVIVVPIFGSLAYLGFGRKSLKN